MWAVMAGTFTLRFSTGLTGAMLGVYLAKLPEHGGAVVAATTLGLLHATFYLSELVLSPIFGVLSDRLGHHRVMLFGPAFGAVAVILTGLTTNLVILGGTRLLEGASTAASIPSILGYIALATAGNELLRGQASARFEGATLAGIGVGFAVAPLLFGALGQAAFFLNAAVLRRVVPHLSVRCRGSGSEERAAAAAARKSPMDLARYGALLRTSHVWLLAPTWIAVNASIGVWFSQSIFQFSAPNPNFPDQVLHQGFSPLQISLAAVAVGVLFGAGLIYWGNRFKSLRRTTIILYGIGGGALVAVGGLAINHGGVLPLAIPIVAIIVVAFGLFVLAGATPAALGLLADISERFPTDRGAIMGLYSVFLAVGQITGSLIGGVAADWRGFDGLLIATFVLLAIAVIPLAQLRRYEHYVGGPAVARDHQRGCRMTRRPRSRPGDARPRPPRRGRRAAPSRDRGGALDPARRRLRGGCRDRHECCPRGRRAVELRDRRRRVLARVGGVDGSRVRPERIGPGAGLGGRGRAPRPGDGHTAVARAAHDHRPGCRPVVGRRPQAVRAPVAGGRPGPGDRAGPQRLPGVDRAHRQHRADVRHGRARARLGLGLRASLPTARAPWREGELIRLPALATTLEGLATAGFDDFYEGDVGQRQARGLAAAGCGITWSDLRAHTSTWGEPIATDYRGVRVTTHPPNSSGIVALELLNVLERFEPPSPEAFGPAGVTDAEWIHLGIEAAKLVMADRDAHLTDPEFHDVPIDRLLPRSTPRRWPTGSVASMPPMLPPPRCPRAAARSTSRPSTATATR